jgi:hypothetical protein
MFKKVLDEHAYIVVQVLANLEGGNTSNGAQWEKVPGPGLFR